MESKISDNSQVEAILFDLSGTLIDDLSAVYSGYLDLTKKYNIESPSLSSFRKEFMLPYPDYLATQGFKEIENAISFWKYRYSTYSSSIRVFPDVIPCLKKLNSIKLGVVSQTPKDKVQENLKKFNLFKFFDIIIYDKWKPKPDGLLQALKQLDLKDHKNVIYIGDMKEDCIAARAANINPWAIYRSTRSFQTLETLKKGYPTKILRELTEINI